MESTVSVNKSQQDVLSSLLLWWPLLIGLLVLYIPTYLGLLDFAWKSDDLAHGPIVLMIVIYLFWQKRSWFNGSYQAPTSPLLGWIVFCFGIACYLLGRSQDIVILDLGSQIPVIAGITLITRGFPALRAILFPLFFIIFMMPLPLDGLTLPMKMAVSYVTENILFWLDYPIARSGVILQIGQYKLLVADACAGMHTLISLEALGLLYLNLVKHDSATRNIVLAVLIVPISFTANVIRVITLTLITYYFGDEVGQGFIHGFAGMFLFLVALTIIMIADSIIQFLFVKDSKVTG